MKLEVKGIFSLFVNEIFLFFFPFCLGLPLEVPKLEVKLERQLLAYATATASPDPTHICNHSLRQCQIFNLLS